MIKKYVILKSIYEILNFKYSFIDFKINDKNVKIDFSINILYDKNIYIDGIKYPHLSTNLKYLTNENENKILIGTEWNEVSKDWIKDTFTLYQYRIDDPIYVSNDEEITIKNYELCERRFFSHKDGENYFTFADGKNSWTFTGKYESWKYAISQQDLEIINQ